MSMPSRMVLPHQIMVVKLISNLVHLAVHMICLFCMMLTLNNCSSSSSSSRALESPHLTYMRAAVIMKQICKAPVAVTAGKIFAERDDQSVL